MSGSDGRLLGRKKGLEYDGRIRYNNSAGCALKRMAVWEGVSGLHIQKTRWICVIWAILTVVSGMCFETMKEEPFCMCASAKQENTRIAIEFMDEIIGDAQACTAEMLGVHRNAGVRQASGRITVQKREAKPSLHFLCAALFPLKGAERSVSPEIILFYCQYQEGRVLNYIHQSDGKKQI